METRRSLGNFCVHALVRTSEVSCPGDIAAGTPDDVIKMTVWSTAHDFKPPMQVQCNPRRARGWLIGPAFNMHRSAYRASIGQERDRKMVDIGTTALGYRCEPPYGPAPAECTRAAARCSSKSRATSAASARPGQWRRHPTVIDKALKPMLAGEDPLLIEVLSQRMFAFDPADRRASSPSY